MALNAKQRAFVREYQKDHNATQAAIRAGYSKNGANRRGSELLSNVDIANALKEREDKAARIACLDRAWVLSKLKDEASGADKSSERTRAIELIGRAVEGGIFRDKVDHGIEEKSLAQILASANKEGE